MDLYNTFGNTLGIEDNFAKDWKGSCCFFINISLSNIYTIMLSIE